MSVGQGQRNEGRNEVDSKKHAQDLGRRAAMGTPSICCIGVTVQGYGMSIISRSVSPNHQLLSHGELPHLNRPVVPPGTRGGSVELAVQFTAQLGTGKASDGKYLLHWFNNQVLKLKTSTALVQYTPHDAMPAQPQFAVYSPTGKTSSSRYFHL